MSKELNDALQEIIEEIGETLESIEEKLEDAAEDITEGWQRTRNHIHLLREKAHNAIKQLEPNIDQANLQAHLAAMEASIRAEAVQELIADFAHYTRNRTKTEFDHAKVQSKLAQMEAKDFVKEASTEISEEIISGANMIRQFSSKLIHRLNSFSDRLRAMRSSE